MTELSLERVREHAREFEEEHKEPIRKVIAVLIMIVTLLVAATAYFETRSGNREAVAKRSEQLATIASMSAAVAANRNTSEEYGTGELATELLVLSREAVGPGGSYRTELDTAYGTAAAKAECNTAALFAARYKQPGCGFDYWRFFEDQQRSPALAVARATAAGVEARGWSSQRGRFITVITIFAVSLFLIGLTLTVPPAARRPFLWLGSFAAIIGLAWGSVVLASRVQTENAAATRALSAGDAALTTAEFQTDAHSPGNLAITSFKRSVASLTASIDAGETNPVAYIDLGDDHLNLDLLNPKGPQGSKAATTDFARAVQLDPRNYIAWGDLGAARFWLHDYQGALDATDTAISLHDGEPIFLMNETLYYLVLGRTSDYRRELGILHRRLASLPSWARNLDVGLYQTAISDAENHRPAIAADVQRFDRDLHAITYGIEVAEKDFGRRTAPRSPSQFSFVGFKTFGTQLTATFHFSAMTPKMKFLDYIYVNGVRIPQFGPYPWPKVGGSHTVGTLPITVNRPLGWTKGIRVLVEIFVDGDLRASHEFVVQ